MFEHPWFLLLLLPIWFLTRGRRHYLRHSYVKPISKSTWKSKSRHVVTFLNIFAISWLVVAAANYYVSVEVKQRVVASHNYVFINDASGSMIDMGKKNGVGKNMKAVLDGNKAFISHLNNKDVKDLLGAIVFSDDAYIVSYLVDDPSFVQKKLLSIDYRDPPLNSGTMLDNALWSGISIILNKNLEKKDNFFDLQNRFYGQGINIKIDNKVKEFVDNKERYTGSSLIIFTDGIILHPAGADNYMSIYKMLDFCKMLGIRVYFLSVERIPGMIGKFTKDTGGFSMILGSDYDSKIGEIYESIALEQVNEYNIKSKEVSTSSAEILALGSLCFMLISFILSNTLTRNFTEV